MPKFPDRTAVYLLIAHCSEFSLRVYSQVGLCLNPLEVIGSPGDFVCIGFYFFSGAPGEGSMEANLTAKGGAKAGDSNLLVRLDLRV